jgi:uncharacterized membrane protein YkoI
MKRLLMAVLVALPLAASANAAFKDCSMKAEKTAKKADLVALAKIKPEEAKSIALKDHPGGSITKGGIETEEGCLVYSYHVKDASGKGQTEVLVDAGNGIILKTDHEGAMRTAMEKPVDKTKELAGKAKEKVTDDPSTNHSMTK